jgi:bis(5'-nucleosyl)-tetraphosphatase (symmetrical)
VTRWAIGDIQGCMSSLEQLLRQIGFDRARDQLWLVGDLVNRGPRSLDVLRWAAGLGDAAVSVLGNHDLHLLARVAGTAKAKKRDTLDEILAARDRDTLIDWLRTRPLVHVEDGYLLVHAGLHPAWSVSTAQALSAEICHELRGPAWRDAMADLVSGRAPTWHAGLRGDDRRRAALAYFTRVRMCAGDGAAEPAFDGPPDEAPDHLHPWFALPSRAWTTHVPVFGHWAALGLRVDPGHIALDSACVWGGKLTAMRLDDFARP